MLTTNIYKHNLKAFYNDKDIMINQGGTGSSKTYSILQLIIFLSQIEQNSTFSIVAESMPVLQRGAIKDFLKIFKEGNNFIDANWKMNPPIYKMGSNTIEFFSVEDDSKCRGPRREYLFLNEANNIKWDTFNQLAMRTKKAIFIDFNPVSSFWAHTKIMNNENHYKYEYIHSTYLDNPYLSKKEIDDIERKRDMDPNDWRVYGLGEIGSLEGLIFNNWDIYYDNKEGKDIVYGLDFGFTNDPSTLIAVWKQEGELYVDEIFYDYGMMNDVINEQFKENGLRQRYDEIYCDVEPKTVEELYRLGWNIKQVKKGADSVNFGIGLIKQHKLHVSSRSINLIKELRNYQWIKDRDGIKTNKPSQGNDHAIDAMRYAIMSKFGVSNFKFEYDFM